jgi:hypothetical protein
MNAKIEKDGKGYLKGERFDECGEFLHERGDVTFHSLLSSDWSPVRVWEKRSSTFTFKH